VYKSDPSPSSGEKPEVGRRFGNAFTCLRKEGVPDPPGKPRCDRLFHLRYDGSDGMKSLNAAEAKCKSKCEDNPLCLAVFTWKQAAHKATADRLKPSKETGYACVGLTSARVYGNYFSYDGYITKLDADQLKVAQSGNYTLLEKGDGTQLDEYSMIASEVYGFSGHSRSIIKEFLWDPYHADAADHATAVKKCKIGTGATGVYNGACKHKQTGFCMEEIPGTAKCVEGFEHAGLEYIKVARNQGGSQ